MRGDPARDRQLALLFAFEKLIEHSAFGEMFLLHLLPATESILNRYKAHIRVDILVLCDDVLVMHAVEVLGQDFLPSGE